MKKAMFVLLAVTLLGSLTFAHAPMTANGTAVAITSNVPEYIGFTSGGGGVINLDYPTARGLYISTGNTYSFGPSPSPTTYATWNLTYNLAGAATVTVCAYATDLAGTGTNTYKIAASQIYGNTLPGIVTATQTEVHFTGSGCGQPHAVTLDTIVGAVSNTGHAEGFSAVGFSGVVGVIPPDTYSGTMNIVAQVI